MFMFQAQKPPPRHPRILAAGSADPACDVPFSCRLPGSGASGCAATYFPDVSPFFTTPSALLCTQEHAFIFDLLSDRRMCRLWL